MSEEISRENPSRTRTSSPRSWTGSADRAAAVTAALAGFGGLLSASACCVLPLVLAALGIGATGLGVIVPFHWPLTILAALAVTAGWLLYARKRRACASDAPPSRGPFAILCAATLLLIISAIWSFIEMPLMKILAE